MDTHYNAGEAAYNYYGSVAACPQNVLSFYSAAGVFKNRFYKVLKR